ncbi:unnamed protein product [Rotaria sp. Silwood1]|nr:unnamed protein product [Rotaria sp. Silwood1]CAF0962587.1 unnamed protein product [Rotaria sp. Silwood1]CAF3348272.1 unnamed protein product [Rotaria sp. Silwood1]CAF3418389.1 unnamed protein product [Rotaria sp. Silwood1]CAF4572086.1 unnamed protein product [Rotaria sp. Silwood1]
MIPLFLRLAIVWLAWSTGRMLPCIVLLKLIVGAAQPGTYSLNSWYFLRKFWLRQLVVRSLAFSFVSNFGFYHTLFPRLLQWLGVRIDETNDIRISQAHFLLAFPTNLVQLEPGSTVNGFALFIPFTVTRDGQCKVNHIRIGRNAQLGNHCTIQPGANIAERTLVGTMTRIDEETSTTINDDDSSGSIVLGIPGGTQWLIILLRRLKANIGRDVIIGEMNAVEDWKHVTIGSHVRLSTTAKIQCHTDEGRIHQLAPVTIGPYSRLFHWAFVFPGAHAQGNNTIHPLTLIMKDDQLPKNTEWRGCPAT